MIREGLADYVHQAWSRWMNHLFESSMLNSDGTVTIPTRLVERWKRQAETPYARLSNCDKLIDRKEADIILKILDDAHFGEW